MNKTKNKKKIQTYLMQKVRISGINSTSYERLWGIELSRFSFIFLGLFFLLILFIASFLMLSYSPLKSLLPDSAFKSKNNEVIEQQILKINQLESKVNLQTRYINDFKNVILGKPIPSDKGKSISKENIHSNAAKLNAKSNPVETKFIKKIETDIRNNAFQTEAKQSAKGVFFFTPIKGIVSNNFSDTHPGVDVVAKSDTPIKSVFDGIVVFSDWTQENGYTIIIRHPNHFLSIYKHNSSLLKKQGDKIKTGDPIAIIGDTGENTTGTHLHFELLFEGKNVNPMDFISFQ